MDVRGGRFRVGVAHQLAQDQQVDASGGQLGAERVAKPVRADPGRAGAAPVRSEDPAKAGAPLPSR